MSGSSRSPAPFPPIGDLVPHRPPSLLIDELIEADETGALSRVLITPRSLYFEDAGVPALTVIEYMAQTIAAYSGNQRKAGGSEVQLGFLLACRKLTLAVDTLQAGDELRVEVRKIWAGPPLAQFECEVRKGDQTIANATLSVYEGPLEELPAS